VEYRNRIDIAAEMLASAAVQKVTKTRIRYRAFVPHEQMTEFLDILIGSELLRFNQEEHLYQTTEKGKKFLDMYNGVRKCVGYK
jgi:predicted transcriptional regulator